MINSFAALCTFWPYVTLGEKFWVRLPTVVVIKAGGSMAK